MKKLAALFMLLSISIGVLADSIPAPKDEFLFKVDDIYSLGMGNAVVALPNKFGIVTNPATMGNLEKKHFNMTYEVSDYNDFLAKDEVVTKGNPSGIYLITNLGGMYIRNLADGKEKSVKNDPNHKYNLDLKEIGVSIVNKSDTVQGFTTGLNLKLYVGHIIDIAADENNKLLYSHADRGFGGGVDLGLLWKKEFVSLGLAWNDIFSRVWWSEYRATTINGTLNGGVGFDFNFMKYGLSVKKVMLQDYPFEFGSGMELVVISLPPEYSYNFLKEARVKLRTGVYGENILEEKKDFHYGAEVSNKAGYLDVAVISKKANLFEVLDDNVYKMSVGLNY